MIYTGIGSRKTPGEICDRMTLIAYHLSLRGHVLRSGHAARADKAFEDGCCMAKENMEIYIPWKSFAKELKPYHIFKHDYDTEQQAESLASDIHPAWSRCSQGAKKLHTRNIYQVLGRDLKTPSDFLLCWTEDGLVKGGTRTAILLAERNNIPVLNFFDHQDKSAIEILKYLIKNYKLDI